MCGIVGYVGTCGVTMKSLLKNVEFNIHRGDDGIGVLYHKDNNWYIQKYLYSILELNKKKLNQSSATKRVRIGAVEYDEFDEELYKQKNAKFEEELNEFHKIVSNFIIIHSRKATYGSNSIDNLHPIEVNHKFYIHNGTAYGVDSVKRYLEVFEGIIFKSETDTEVIALLYNHLKQKLNNDVTKIFEVFKGMFSLGWGVLIEIDLDGKITIIKDDTRSLWVYKKYNDGIVFISEPTPYLKSFDEVVKLPIGIYELNDKCKGIDYTEMARKTKNWWWKCAKVGDIKLAKCDICEQEKLTLNTSDCEGHPYESDREDRCFECFVLNTKNNGDDEYIEMTSKKLSYESFLGGRK